MQTANPKIKRFVRMDIAVPSKDNYPFDTKMIQILVEFDFVQDNMVDSGIDNIHEVEILNVIDVENKKSIFEDVVACKYDISYKHVSEACSLHNFLKNSCFHYHIDQCDFEFSTLPDNLKIAYAHAYCDYILSNINEDNSVYSPQEVIKIIEDIQFQMK